MIKTILFLFIIAFSTTLQLFAQGKEFRYVFHEGDQFRFLSTVNSETGWSDEPLRRTQVINRISFMVAEVAEDGSARLVGEMHSSEQREGEISSLSPSRAPCTSLSRSSP